MYPQKYPELQPKILHAFTLPPIVIFVAIWKMVKYELFKKIGWELVIILLNDPNMFSETNYFVMKEYSAL